MSGDRYLTVRVRIEEVRPTSVLFRHGDTTTWVPRSLVHGADDADLDGRFAGEEIALRIFAWKCRELGLEGERDRSAAARDLFDGDGE